MKNKNRSNKLVKFFSTFIYIVLLYVLAVNIIQIVSNVKTYNETVESINVEFDFLHDRYQEYLDTTRLKSMQISGEISQYIKEDLVQRTFESNVEIQRENTLIDISKIMYDYIVPSTSSSIFIYYNLEELGINETPYELTLVKGNIGIDNLPLIVQKSGPIFISEILKTEYSYDTLNISVVEEQNFYKNMKINAANYNKEDIDGDLTYWYRGTSQTYEGVDFFMSSYPIIIDNKTLGIVGITLNVETFFSRYRSINPEVNNLKLYLAENQNGTFKLLGAPQDYDNFKFKRLSLDEPIEIVKYNFPNLYNQGQKLLYGYDLKFNPYSEQSVYDHPEYSMLFLTEDLPILHWLNNAVNIILVIATSIIMIFFDRRFNLLIFANKEPIKIMDDTQELSESEKLKQIYSNNLDTLTPREFEILGLYNERFTQKDIAKDLDISINTVKSHSRNIYQKMGVGTLRELMKLIKENK